MVSQGETFGEIPSNISSKNGSMRLSKNTLHSIQEE